LTSQTAKHPHQQQQQRHILKWHTNSFTHPRQKYHLVYQISDARPNLRHRWARSGTGAVINSAIAVRPADSFLNRAEKNNKQPA